MRNSFWAIEFRAQIPSFSNPAPNPSAIQCELNVFVTRIPAADEPGGPFSPGARRQMSVSGLNRCYSRRGSIFFHPEVAENGDILQNLLHGEDQYRGWIFSMRWHGHKIPG